METAIEAIEKMLEEMSAESEKVKRMINNLIFAFDKIGNEAKSNDMKLLLKCFKN